MSLISSLNEPIQKSDLPSSQSKQSQWLSDLLGRLISEQAELLAKVETGEVAQSVLEMEIAKLVDQSGQYAGRSELIQELINHMFGYGILQSYLENPQITDLIGTRYDHFFVKIKGHFQRVQVSFPTEKAFENYCKLVVIRNGGILNENDNHARVADENLKLRINAVIPPRSAQGAFLSIRKHREEAYDLDGLEEQGMLDTRSKQLVREIAGGHSRFLICGKGAAGKTTLLRAMINALGDQQRLLVCESDTEIYPESPTVMVQRVLTRGQYGKQVSLNTLIKDGLTMSLDGYCIGEITGPEAWDFVKAGYTDHRVMGTIHSAGATEAVYRLLVLSEIAQLGISEEIALNMIRRSLDYVIYVKGFKVISISRLVTKAQSERVLETIYESEVS